MKSNWKDSSTLMSNALSLDDQHYFSPLNTGWNSSGGPILASNGIKDQVEFCKAAGRRCKIVMGFETSDEDPSCSTYRRSKSSFVWGGGLAGNYSIIDWIEGQLEPFLSASGIDVNKDFYSVPYFVEHQASFMAYLENVKKGVFPATQCYRAACTTCCPNQKHKKLC